MHTFNWVMQMEYKSIEKYLNKNKEKFSIKKFLIKLSIKILICIIIFLTGLIILKYDKAHDKIIYNFMESHNISMASINNLYHKYLGNILPFENVAKENITKVFNEEISYKEASIYKEGVKLTVTDNYLIPVLESGVVVFIGEKEDYGKVVMIEQVDGVTTWYGNIDNISINLYDYVSKGEFLGESKGNYIYLVFEKKGSYLNYKEYFKKI